MQKAHFSVDNGPKLAWVHLAYFSVSQRDQLKPHPPPPPQNKLLSIEPLSLVVIGSDSFPLSTQVSVSLQSGGVRLAVKEGASERVLMEGEFTHKINTENSLWSLEPGRCVLVRIIFRRPWSVRDYIANQRSNWLYSKLVTSGQKLCVEAAVYAEMGYSVFIYDSDCFIYFNVILIIHQVFQ